MSGPERGVITKGVFSLEKSLESLKSLDSLESLENGRNLLSFPQSGDSLETLESLNSLESLENGLFCKDPFSKRPLFPNPIMGAVFGHPAMVENGPSKKAHSEVYDLQTPVKIATRIATIRIAKILNR